LPAPATGAPRGPSESPSTPFDAHAQTIVARSLTEASSPPPITRRDRTLAGSNDSGARGGFRPAVGSRFGRYELLAELGRGGMGIVFRARQTDLQREVALKMLLEGGAAGDLQRDRFFAEARHAAKLMHPSIVAVHDVGELDGIHYFTMDYVEGQDLAAIVKGGKMEPLRAVDIALKLCLALGYAHTMGVVHRDLKPSNILIDKHGTPRITDFGIAKDLEKQSTTLSGEVLGTPAYMPPEQADGRAGEVDARADVYSLGAVLYELLTGRPPFEAKTGFLVMTAVLNDPPVPPRRVDPSLPRDLETIVLKCLEKKRENRYPTTAALAADLERFMDGESIEAQRPITLPGGPPRRVLLVGLLVLAALGAGYFVYDSKMKQRAAEAATAQREKELADAALRAQALEEERKAEEKSSALVRDAVEAAAREERDVAIARAQEAVEVAPKHALAHETLARFYLELRSDPDGAMREADAAIKLDPTSREGLSVRARALIAERRLDEALPEIEKVAALGADGAAAAARLRGEALNAKGDGEGALRELGRACDLAPRDAAPRVDLARAFLALGKAAEAERAASSALEIDPQRAAALVARAEARLALGRDDEALADAVLARKLAPRDAAAKALAARLEARVEPKVETRRSDDMAEPATEDERHRLAEEVLKAFQHGDRKKAEAFLAARWEHECVHVLAIRSTLLKALGRLEDAEAALTRACEMDPTIVANLGNRGLIRLQLKRWDDALADFDLALKDGTPQGMLPAAIGRAQAWAGKERWEEAAAAWQQALDAAVTGQQRAAILHDRAKFWLGRERLDASIADLDQAITLMPAAGHYYYDRAEAREKQGDRAGAANDWKLGLEKGLVPAEAERAREGIKKAESP
jgi:tetratricopeptide (TPR) repeat protein